MTAYTREHMAVSQGAVVKQSETPHALLNHPTYGLVSVTHDGNYWWVRFARPVPAQLESIMRTQGWWYSDRKGTGRKGWWCDTQRVNPFAVLEHLGVTDIPDLSQVVRVKPERKAATPKPAPKAAKSSKPAPKTTVTEAGETVTWNGYRWVDANGRFVKNPTTAPKQVTVQAKQVQALESGRLQIGESIAQVVTPTPQAQVQPAQPASMDKLALLQAALAQQAALIKAISEL